MTSATIESLAEQVGRLKAEIEHLQRQIGYIVTELMIAGDKRSLPEIVETAAARTIEKHAAQPESEG